MLIATLASTSLAAQWTRYPHGGITRPNVGPTPHGATSRRMINLGADPPGGLAYQPRLAELTKARWAANAKDDPARQVLSGQLPARLRRPHLLKLVQNPVAGTTIIGCAERQ